MAVSQSQPDVDGGRVTPERGGLDFQVVQQGEHVGLVAIDVVCLDTARPVALTVPSMVEQDAPIPLRKRPQITRRPPKLGIAACAQVQQERGTFTLDFVLEADPVRGRDKWHWGSIPWPTVFIP